MSLLVGLYPHQNAAIRGLVFVAVARLRKIVVASPLAFSLADPGIRTAISIEDFAAVVDGPVGILAHTVVDLVPA